MGGASGPAHDAASNTQRRRPPARVWSGEIFFRAVEGSTGFAYRVRPDGTELRKAILQSVLDVDGVSPDGQWLVASSPIPSEAAYATMAHPLRGGTPILISNRAPRPKWLRDGRFLYLSIATAAGSSYVNGNTYVLPFPAGRVLPDFPREGLSEEDIAKWLGCV